VFPVELYLAAVNFSFITIMMLLSIQNVLLASDKYRTMGAFLFSTLCGLIIILSFTKLIDILILGSSIKYLLELVLVLLISTGLSFCVFVICHERKLMELLSLKRKLKEEVERKNHYLVTFSHELRTPLNAMVGIAQLMKTKLLDKALLNDCDIIIESGQSLSNLATSILDYSSFEAKEGSSLTINNVSILDISHSVLALLRPLAQEKKILLQTNVSKEVKVIDFVELDKNKFRQILINLLGNAIKYTDKGSVTLSLKVRKDLPGKTVIRFSVEDTGIGISEVDQKKLLQPFHQAYKHENNTGLTNNDGVGFGLAHTDYLVRLMSSQLYFTSTLKKGSKFYFDLVLKKVDPKENVIVLKSSNQAKPLDILVVEDIEVNQKILERMLVIDRHNVTISSTGTEAIMLLKNQKFDLLFLDMLLPDMHGLTLLEYINNDKDLKDRTKVVAVTASVTIEQIKTYEESGIIEVIKKPIMQEKLKQVMSQIFINENNKVNPSAFIKEQGYDKMLFNAKTLKFFKENLSTVEFIDLVAGVSTSIDKHINEVISARENNNDDAFIDELHRLAGFSAQMGLEQLCEAAIALQRSNKNNQQKNLTHLLMLAKSSVSTFKEENV
jgi:signal transduction histidine kinase/response regulator of citrate/malate metabolism